MSNWILHPLTLTGNTVDLISLGADHFLPLQAIAKEKRIWEFYPYDGSNSETFRNIFKSSIIERDIGNQFPFAIFHKKLNRIIGSTRFMDIQPKHRKLEIGTTWLHPDYWATEVNLECKLLLLQYCFEVLLTVRVQLKTDENNLRSRKAIEKIGGLFEGVFRNDMIRDNNTRRNSAYYSFVEEEWEEKKKELTRLYNSKRNAL
ncbi:MAG: GNAT family N-acetyltransferase [Bacteroidota bacterium]